MRPTTREDAIYLSPRLRQADQDEIRAVTGAPAILVLPQCVECSRAAWTLYGYDDLPVGLLGVQDIPGVPSVGRVWMLCTPVIERHSIRFLKECRKGIEAVHSFHPIITNHVDERNTLHIKWLRWMGFSFLRRIERWGAEGRPFIEFARLQPSCASES